MCSSPAGQWTGGMDTALDMTVVRPLQTALVAGVATTPGSALNHAHQDKMRKTEEECRRQEIIFLPLAAKALGGGHPLAVDQVKKLGGALARQTGEEEGVVKNQLS